MNTPPASTSNEGYRGKHGLPPGSIVYLGANNQHVPGIQLIQYGPELYQERDLPRETLQDAAATPDSGINWFNVDGVHDVGLLDIIARGFNIHSLTMEDIANTHQRPKTEIFDDYLFITFKMLRIDPTHDNQIVAEHVGLVLSRQWLWSFQEVPGDVFNVIRNRIRSGKGRIRGEQTDYLAYALLDAVVDSYFMVMEHLGDRIAAIDDLLTEEHPSPDVLQHIHGLKQELIFIRRCAWPLRELVSSLQKTESNLIGKSLQIYLRDLYDHTVQVIDTVETYRDLLASMTDLYHSIVSNRMNQVMKVLTIIATIFIPLTFIAGIYGMNFTVMPELEYRWAYPAVLLVMAGCAAGMVVYFKRKKWF